jgi:hypothetical protein
MQLEVAAGERHHITASPWEVGPWNRVDVHVSELLDMIRPKADSWRHRHSLEQADRRCHSRVAADTAVAWHCFNMAASLDWSVRIADMEVREQPWSMRSNVSMPHLSAASTIHNLLTSWHAQALLVARQSELHQQLKGKAALEAVVGTEQMQQVYPDE